MNANGAFGWALAAAIDRVLAGRTVGYGLNIQRDGVTLADHVYGYARAPWEDTDPALRWESTTCCHIASMSKAITSFALALIIEKWNQVLNLPQHVRLSPIPGFPGIPLPLPPLPWDQRTIGLFLGLCPANVRPDPHWAYRVYANGHPMTVDSKLLTFIGDRLSPPPGNLVAQLSLRNLLEHHSFLQPIDGDDARPDLWGWISRMLARGLSASPVPNAGDQYRNENYTLLRAIIENVSGVGYQGYVYNNVLAPAGAVHFTMQNGDPKPTRYYRQMFPQPNGVPQLPAPGIDFDSDFSATGGALGWHGSPVEYALFLRFLMGHTPTPESSPIVHDHMGWESWWTLVGNISGHNGEWGGGNAAVSGWFDGAFYLFPDRTIVVAMTNTGMTVAFQGIVLDAILSVLPTIEQRRPFAPPIARYGGRLGDLRYKTNAPGAVWTPVAVNSPLPLNAATHMQLAVFDGAAMVTPPVLDQSGSPVQDRPADAVLGPIHQGLRFWRFPWDKLAVPEIALPHTEDISDDLTAAIAAESGLGHQNFAYVWWGYINVPTEGAYIFATISDDGSVVWIDDVKVVSNDGWHSAKDDHGNDVEVRGTLPVKLGVGRHPILISYMNAPGGARFELRWMKPGDATTVSVPVNALSSL